jgi:hypothetical protein
MEACLLFLARERKTKTEEHASLKPLVTLFREREFELLYGE